MNRLKELEAEVLEEGREWTRQRLKCRMEAQAKELGAICPDSGCLLKYRKTRPLTLLSCVGEITIEATSGFSKALGRRVHPAREYWNLAPHQRISPELEDRLAYTATQTGSYQKAALLAERWGTPISDDTVHAVVQRLGEAAEAIELPPVAVPSQEFSLVIMMDGWMVRQRGPNWGVDPQRPPAGRIEWKEVKSAVIYRLETRRENASGRGLLMEKFVVASPPDTSPLDFGAAVQAEARRRGLAQARKVYVVIDGAVWLWNLAKDRFSKAELLLDFHHASEYLWALANELHGQGSVEARTWAEGLLHSLRHGGEAQMVQSLEELLIPKTRWPNRCRRASAGRWNIFGTTAIIYIINAMPIKGLPWGVDRWNRSAVNSRTVSNAPASFGRPTAYVISSKSTSSSGTTTSIACGIKSRPPSATKRRCARIWVVE